MSESGPIEGTSGTKAPTHFRVVGLGASAGGRSRTRAGSHSRKMPAPGCATGEEVYSIAMTLIEALTDANALAIPIKVFGTDVSLRVIDKARTAKYPLSIEHDVSPGRLRRFFTKTENGYQIRKDLRDLCVFARQDATRDPPFAGLDTTHTDDAS